MKIQTLDELQGKRLSQDCIAELFFKEQIDKNDYNMLDGKPLDIHVEAFYRIRNPFWTASYTLETPHSRIVFSRSQDDDFSPLDLIGAERLFLCSDLAYYPPTQGPLDFSISVLQAMETIKDATGSFPAQFRKKAHWLMGRPQRRYDITAMCDEIRLAAEQRGRPVDDSYVLIQ